MTGGRSPLHLIKRAALPAVALLVIVNFAGYAIAGENGVLSLGEYRHAKAEKAMVLVALEEERARLSHRAELLDPQRADPDLAEELVRRELGLVRPDEVIIEIDEAPAAPPAPPSPAH
ncbi:MAG: FtsB family cell division protein [Allosphingosinicella sp.]|uniref:FtsB family cell division protein n=1 Tax=Allosphingosinicella sp. TaxID=2823234 RepID=UPI003958A0E5